MKGSGNSSNLIRVKSHSFLRKSNAYPASVIIEVKNKEGEKIKMSEYVEEPKSLKQVIRQKRKMKADSALYIDVYNLPDNVMRTDTVLRNDSIILRVLEPFYLSKFGHDTRRLDSHPCQQLKKEELNENELESLFEGRFQVKALELLSLQSSKVKQGGEEESSGLATIQVTASLSAEVSPLLKLVGPILANHLKCSAEALELAGRKKEGFDEILSRLAALLSHKTILCDFSGIPREKSSQNSMQSSSSHPSLPPALKSNFSKSVSEFNPLLQSSEVFFPSVPECTFPNVTTCEFN
ncbi:unnamed protein product [Taenia asiatica]|uniref:C2 domain-containing protein n=1 Tax=Taenia asiatica TaxID=60517 RepID=A0A0R3WCP2_TAEAS|nr:unnamed protein product [Taenia asiatica]